jgi:hypothetical protein
VEKLISGIPVCVVEDGFCSAFDLLVGECNRKYHISETGFVMCRQARDAFLATLRTITPGTPATAIPWEPLYRAAELLLSQVALAKGGVPGLEEATSKVADQRTTYEYNLPKLYSEIKVAKETPKNPQSTQSANPGGTIKKHPFRR